MGYGEFMWCRQEVEDNAYAGTMAFTLLAARPSHNLQLPG
jgi:hypothetical protein